MLNIQDNHIINQNIVAKVVCLPQTYFNNIVYYKGFLDNIGNIKRFCLFQRKNIYRKKQ